MTQISRVKVPAGYAPAFAVGYSDASGNLVLTASDTPLPVVLSSQNQIASPAPLIGTSSTSGLVGPFEPAPGIPVMLQLEGVWAGTVQLMRATDENATPVPVTIGGTAWANFTANACEPVWEDSNADARLFLDITLDSGTLSYQVSQ